jgi:4'-phosphopantetheinyl transferase
VEVALTLGEYGKPMASGIHFNMSHTEGVMVLAVGRGVVGIDVEVPATGRDIHGLVNRWFTEAERRQFAALPAAIQPEAFLRGWTCKEAVLKALGTGVRDLQNVSVDLDPRQPPRVLECPGSVRWELECWSVGEAHAALCFC